MGIYFYQRFFWHVFLRYKLSFEKNCDVDDEYLVFGRCAQFRPFLNRKSWLLHGVSMNIDVM